MTESTLISRPQTQVTYAEHASTIQAIAWSPDSTHLVSGDAGGEVRVWEADTGKTRAVHMDDQHAGVSTLAWSPVENLIAEGGRRNCIRLLEAKHLEVVQSWPLQGPSAARPNGAAKYGRPHLGISALSFSPDGRLLLGGGFGDAGEHLYLWETLSGQKLPLDSEDHTINAVAWSPDGQRFAAAGDFGAIGIWEATGEHLLVRFSKANRQSFFYSIGWSPDGTCLATSGLHSDCQVWHGSGELVTRYQGHQGQVFSLAWKPEGECIASASTDQTVQVWEASTGKQLATYQIPCGHHPRVAWSPDGKRLACGIDDGTVLIVTA